MSAKLKTGLIGCGRFAVPGHAIYYRINPRCEFTAVCDLKRESAESVARKFGVKNVYDNYIQMLDEAGLDAVSVCTPTFTHAEITKAAAERGIHVLCEKPFATSPEEGREMIDACARNNVVLHTGFNKRYDRGIEKVHRMILEEKYGRCFHAEFRWSGLSTFGTVPVVNNSLSILQKFGYKMENFSPDWRLSDPRIPGGVLEVICHIVDLALWTFGEPDEVQGDAFAVSDNAVKPEHAAIILKYKTGTSVYLTMSNKAMALGEKETGLFNCTDGNIYYENVSSRQTFLPAKITVETGDGFFGRRRTLPPPMALNPLSNAPHYRRIDNFLLDIRGQLPPEEENTTPRGEAGLAVDKVIHRILDLKR